LYNISCDRYLQKELINNGIMEVIKKYIELFLSHAKERNDDDVDETTEGIELIEVMPMGAVALIKGIAKIIFNLS
jgi:hypothetical protein